MLKQLPIILRQIKASNKRGKLIIRKSPRIRPPLMIEAQYMRDLHGVVADLETMTKQYVIPAVEQAQKDYDNRHPVTFAGPGSHTDSYSDLIKDALQKTRMVFGSTYSDSDFAAMAERIGVETNGFNRKQLTRVLSAMIGVNVFVSEHWLEDVMKGFVHRNVALIKTVPERYFANIESLIYREIPQGIRHEEIAKHILEDRIDATKWDAARIARDQVNKFNGQVNHERQVSVGVTDFIWRTMEDDRVRPEHEDLDGEQFSWDDPPDEGFPGEPIMCRCSAEPVLDNLI